MAMSEQTFNSYLAKILSARYGEEVRGSIHDSLQGMYEIVKGNVLDVTTAKQTIDTAAAAANSAAEKANTSAAKADQATSKANTAASNADAATAKANASATKADTAAAGADTAKNAANTAASNATTEAGKATAAATSATQAASQAASAASSANDAAEKATEATTKANEAASGAGTAADRANSAAQIVEDLQIGDLDVGSIATKEYVGEQISNGTRNLLINSSMANNLNGWKLDRSDRIRIVNEDGYNCLCISGSFEDVASVNQEIAERMSKDTSTVYTISAWVKTANIVKGNTNFALDFYFHTYIDDDWISTNSLGGRQSVFRENNNGWHKAYWVISFNRIPTTCKCNLYMRDYTGDVFIRDVKLERGNFATAWTPAPEDEEHAISRRSTVTYDYGGRNLKDVFGTAEALHNALAAKDYSRIAVGDYWPITLNGTFSDYGKYTVKSGVTYYSNNTLQTNAGTTSATYEGTYVSDTAVSFSLSDTTYYVKVGDCLPYFERTCDNTSVTLEIGSINPYLCYGNSNDTIVWNPNILFISRNGLPFYFRIQKAYNKLENESAETPWLGTAAYKTLNDPDHGIITLLKKTEFGQYIYAGKNDMGMSAFLPTQRYNDESPKGMGWYDRGKLFLPSASEVWGQPFFAETNDVGLGNQLAIFRNSSRHICKNFGDSGGIAAWWSSSYDRKNKNFLAVTFSGICDSRSYIADSMLPICFLFT